MQPDQPQLCRFWLCALIECMRVTSDAELSTVLSLLLCYLWKYTFAAVPEYLRRSLIGNLNILKAALERGSCGSPDANSSSAAHFRNAALQQCASLTWVLTGDSAYAAWAAQEAVPKLLAPREHARREQAETVSNAKYAPMLIARGSVWLSRSVHNASQIMLIIVRDLRITDTIKGTT